MDFNVAEVVEMLRNSPHEDEYSVKLTLTQPNVTVNDIGYEAFPDVLSTFSTEYATSNRDRTTNLRLAVDQALKYDQEG